MVTQGNLNTVEKKGVGGELQKSKSNRKSYDGSKEQTGNPFFRGDDGNSK
jgi:hypothetical protein